MKRRKFLAAVIVVIAAASLAACGGNGPSTAGVSPTAPTTPNSPTAPAVTGATITGSVQGLAGTSSAVGARNAITVTVMGTNLTSTVDASGNFVINGVPGGTVTLAFSGTPATVTISNVGSSDHVKIKIVIAGGTATVESEQHQVDGLAQLEGRVSSIAPPAFYVGDTKVVLGTPITIKRGETSFTTSVELFALLKVGDRVHVAGTATATEFTATTITLQNTNDKVPVNLKGKITNLVAKACPASEFAVEGYTVKTTVDTKFEKAGCSAGLVLNAEVHVKGDVIAANGAVPAYVQATWVQFGK